MDYIYRKQQVFDGNTLAIPDDAIEMKTHNEETVSMSTHWNGQENIMVGQKDINHFVTWLEPVVKPEGSHE